MRINLTEMGNGFPSAGELIGHWVDGEPKLYRVEDGGSIQTAQWQANTCEVDAEPVDADDVEDEIDIDDDSLGLRMIGIEAVE